MQINIYKIVNLANGKIYIGQTRQKISQRWNSHKKATSTGKDLHFYRAIRKYGPEQFQVDHIATAEGKVWADYFERLYIKLHRSIDPEFGYNMTYGGHGGEHREENKKKIGDKSREWWQIPGNRERASESRKGLLAGARNPMFGRHDLGKPHTEETKSRISAVKKLQFEDPEFKARVTAANVGKHHTAEGKANISAALAGNQYRTGKPHDEETKQRISASLRRTFAMRRAKAAQLPALQEPA